MSKPIRIRRSVDVAAVLSTDVLTRIYDEVNLLRELQQTVRCHLPKAMRPHLQVAQYRQKTLVLATSSQAHATRARFMLSALKKQLCSEPVFTYLQNIKLIVFYQPRQPRVSQTVRQLPAAAGDALNRLAEDIQNKELQHVLRRLAGHAQDATETSPAPLEPI